MSCMLITSSFCLSKRPRLGGLVAIARESPGDGCQGCSLVRASSPRSRQTKSPPPAPHFFFCQQRMKTLLDSGVHSSPVCGWGQGGQIYEMDHFKWRYLPAARHPFHKSRASTQRTERPLFLRCLVFASPHPQRKRRNFQVSFPGFEKAINPLRVKCSKRGRRNVVK